MHPVVLVLGLMLTACAPMQSTQSSPTLTPSAQISANTALRTCQPGTWDSTMSGLPVRVHIPRGARMPLPAVIVLHGAGDTGPGVQKQSGMDTVADRNGFMTVYPTQPSGQWPLTEDGTRAINTLVDGLPCADPRRRYLTGFSRGSAMTFRVACSTQPRRFAAFGGVAFADYRSACGRSKPAAWVYLHGSNDQTVSYQQGFTLRSGRTTAPTRSAMRSWARHNNCRVGPQVRHVGDTTLRRWTRCSGSARVDFYTIRGGDHQWPFEARPNAAQLAPGQSWASVGASKVMWRFFEKRRLPSS